VASKTYRCVGGILDGTHVNLDMREVTHFVAPIRKPRKGDDSKTICDIYKFVQGKLMLSHRSELDQDFQGIY